MTKTQVISYINSRFGAAKLNTKNTTFASISTSPTRVGWWMNIKLKNFKKDWNIILNGEDQIKLLQIPAATFTSPVKNFRIWESKNAADILISSDRQDRYLKDILSGGTGVDFKPFIVEKFSIPEELKSSSDKKSVSRPALKPEVISFTSVPKLDPVVRKQRIIVHNQTNITYEKLFGEFLKGADYIELQDPWIRLPYQFQNLLEFCVMLGNNNNEPGRTISLKVISWNTREFQEQSKTCFEEIAASVKDMRINLTFALEKHHDRYIKANNDCKIILGRGLDIYEKREGRFSIGDVDQRWRKCKPCEITYLVQTSV
ncbi:MIT C-terminal domain-containing protein [Salinimicrobium flavum]|uniref:MIT C-terminal domain-containing protein n=1 Tax=Salinimicrobium flavum TaxID=1737065 RepID=A0ABW5IXP1_9FLAO